MKYNLLFIALFSFSTLWVQAQEIKVSGKVSEAGSGSLPGVNVLVKGTSQGTVTDIDGNFTIGVGSDATLVFSFIGFVTEEVVVGARTFIEIELSPDIRQLSEIVVIGYGEQEKSDVTGVIQSVSSEDFNRGAIISPEQLMVGKLAGVRITPNSGEPGGKVKIRIRGGTSITAGNEPLFVIDGIPILNDAHDPGGQSAGRNPLNFLAPDDIESITVLKDASAAAIYGSRAANGVIIITTKKGEKGESKISYSGYYSIANNIRTVDMLDKEAYINVVTAKAPSKLENFGL
jgi:TonB-dependent starch-binding outer membrane protein SusC